MELSPGTATPDIRPIPLKSTLRRGCSIRHYLTSVPVGVSYCGFKRINGTRHSYHAAPPLHALRGWIQDYLLQCLLYASYLFYLPACRTTAFYPPPATTVCGFPFPALPANPSLLHQLRLVYLPCHLLPWIRHYYHLLRFCSVLLPLPLTYRPLPLLLVWFWTPRLLPFACAAHPPHYVLLQRARQDLHLCRRLPAPCLPLDLHAFLYGSPPPSPTLHAVLGTQFYAVV